MMNPAHPSGNRTHTGGVRHYGERVFNADRHDPYQAAGKYREPTQCEDCGAVYHRGRWEWGSAPADAQAALCPACRRVRDKLPAGRVVLEGPFVAIHRSDLMNLVRNEAAHEGREHPLHRLMEVEERPDRVDLATTDIHLPRRIGDALHRAYDGELDIKYGDQEYTVRVHWRR